MPIDVTLDPDAKRLLVKITGEINDLEIRSAIETALSYDFGPDYQILSDHRDITEAITPVQLSRMVGQLGRHAAKLKGVRWAVVVSGAASYGMMRMLASHSDSISLEVRVFYSIDEAEAWLAAEE